MIRIQVFKASQLLYIAAVVVLCLLILGLAVSYFLNRAETASPPQQTAPAQTAAQPSSPSPTLDVGLEAAADKEALSLNAEASQAVAKVAELLIDVDPLDPLSVLNYQFPFIEEPTVAANADADENIPDAPDDVERIRVEIEKITGGYEAPEETDKLRVLIYHTHSYEAFAQEEDNPYEETSQWRSADMNFNIMGVGEALAQELRSLGIEVVHDLTEHEPPKLGTAYERSLKTLEGYAAAGETFDMMIDLHRDAASSRNTNPSFTVVDEKECANLMMLIGTGEDGFSVMPNWKENYKLAQALTDYLNGIQEGLCRDVMVKTGRYNQHMSESAVLIEVGHNENTLEQALNATKPLAKAIAAVLRGETVETEASLAETLISE